MGLFDRFKNQEARGQEFYCIVGLGNPGREYAETKHNVGFCVIDKLAEKYEIKVEKYKNKALIGDGMIRDKRVLLVKPQTFTSLPCGSVRIREKGSHGGHNGIRNIIDQMGTDVFNRIKVGIGEKPKGWDLADYVLAKFSPDDLPAMEEGMEKAVKGVELILSRGVAEAANRVNQKPKSMKKQKALQEQAEKAEKETEKTTDGVNKE